MAGSVERNGFKRVMLKLGGEMFGGGKAGVDPDVAQNVARQIVEVSRKGVEVCVVTGGDNLSRSAQLQQYGMDHTRSNYTGMLGTVMNCLTLQDFLEQEGVDRRVQTAINMAQVSEPYLPLRARCHLEKDRMVIFGTGMSMPYFSTDTAAAQRALEIGCKVLLIAKAVDGVHPVDPHEMSDAELFDDITHCEVLEQDLCIADVTALSPCMDNNMSVLVFNLLIDGNIVRAVAGEQTGTLAHSRQICS